MTFTKIFHNTYAHFYFERMATRPTILGLTMIEPLIALICLIAALWAVQHSVVVNKQTFLTQRAVFHRLTMGSNFGASKGFTIIEVLIVLAIAGLIMLIVFLAVPALQRNSRNTSYRTEASRLLAVTTEFTNNNNGTLPAASTCTGTGGAATNCDLATSPNNAMSIWQLAAPKNITSLTVVASSATSVTPTTTAATIDTGATCPTTISGTSVTPVTTGAPARSVIIIYAIESSSGLLAQCR